MGVMNEDRLTLYDGLIKTHITNTTVAKETGKGLSTNDYTTTEKNKLAGIATGANKTTVDDALSSTSTNPVQNKVVTSNLTDIRKETTVNVLNPTLKTTEQNGVTCTHNGDGTYTLNGTATANTYFTFESISKFEDKMYKIVVFKNANNNVYSYVNAKTLDGKWEYSILHEDLRPTGYISKNKYKSIDMGIAVKRRTTLTNEIIKPMLTTNLSATYDDFVPYTGDTGRLNGDVAELNKTVDTLKKSVSDGKTLVATAITEKGVDTAADATFAVMAENISQIETGGGELHGATISVATNEENPTTITVTLTKDSTTIGQKNFDSNGLCTFTDIQESGDYTVTASDGTDSNSTTVTITSDNIVNKTVTSVTIGFTLDGSTATPLNDVSIWLRTDSTGSSLNAGHTTLAQVIADPDTLNNLMRDQSAMQYLARSTGFADEGCASETFMTYLGASPYVDSTVLNSDLWVSAIKQSPYKNKVLKQAELVVGNTYKFGGYNWIVAEKSDVSGYAVLQSTGVTGGRWAGYAMSGTLTNAAGSTITLTGANTYYIGNIDGYDISNYNSTTQSLYSSIKAAEYTAATYGKGLYLVSNSKAGTTSSASQGSGYYWSALKSAATNYSSFGAGTYNAWLGTVNGSYYAWCIVQDGGVNVSYGQNGSCVVAPAFNLDTCLIKVSGDEIVLL